MSNRIIKYGILGEDESDVKTLREIIRRLRGDQSVPIHGQGFSGHGDLKAKGERALRSLYESGHERFIICRDADTDDPKEIAEIRKILEEWIIKPSGVRAACCIAVPVQAIEAWILADIESLHKQFRSWKPREVKSPERIPHPKDELVRISRQGLANPRYIPTTHNHQVIKHLSLDRIAKKCPSFRQLRDFILES